MTRRLASPINRRAFLGVTPGAFASLLDAKLLRAGDPPLKITKVEAIVIRTPKDERAHEDFVEMPPLGSLTGGPGLWNRLDHASPSRMKGATQATLVKITTDRGLVGCGESHAPAAPRVHQSAQRVALEVKEHRQILFALRKHHAGRLMQALSRHIERSKGVLTADLAQQPVFSRGGPQRRPPSEPAEVRPGKETEDRRRSDRVQCQSPPAGKRSSVGAPQAIEPTKLRRSRRLQNPPLPETRLEPSSQNGRSTTARPVADVRNLPAAKSLPLPKRSFQALVTPSESPIRKRRQAAAVPERP